MDLPPNTIMLSQPFFADDGSVNPAAENELEAVLRRIPRPYDRFNNDPEWIVERHTQFREITGALAYWAIRQNACDEERKYIPACPPNLETVIQYLTACVRKRFDESGFSKLSLCSISRMLYDILWDMKEFKQWGEQEIMGTGISLDALLLNVCIMIRDERRANDKFNAEFEKKYGKLEI